MKTAQLSDKHHAYIVSLIDKDKPGMKTITDVLATLIEEDKQRKGK